MKSLKEKNQDINIKKTIKVLDIIEKKLLALGVDRIFRSKLGTALYLANIKITQKEASSLMSDYGGISEVIYL